MSISRAVKELENYYTTKKTRSRLEKHCKLQALNFDWNPSGRMLTSDFKQHGRKREFKGKEKKLLM